MKTVLFFSAAALLAATVISSCANNDEVASGNDRVEVKFAPARADVETRVTGTNWDGGERIGIYMLTRTFELAANRISDGVNNREYQNAAAIADASATFTPLSTASTIYYPANQDGNVVKVKFIAYYPYGPVTDGATTFTRAIEVLDQTNQSAIDVLYAPADDEYDKNSPEVQLPFVHKLVKLEFIINNGAGVTAPLDGLEVKITKQQGLSTLDLVTGIVPVSVGGPTELAALTAGDGRSSEAIVLPLNNTSDTRFIFINAAGEEFTGTVPDANWDGGKKYTYTVTLKKNETSIVGSIADWGAGNTGETLDAN